MTEVVLKDDLNLCSVHRSFSKPLRVTWPALKQGCSYEWVRQYCTEEPGSTLHRSGDTHIAVLRLLRSGLRSKLHRTHSFKYLNLYKYKYL